MSHALAYPMSLNQAMTEPTQTFSYNPSIDVDCAPSHKFGVDDEHLAYFEDRLEFIQSLPSVPGGVANPPAFWGPIRDITTQSGQVQRVSATCTAVIDAIQWHLRRAKQLPPTVPLSADALSAVCKRVAPVQELTTIYHALVFAHELGLLQEEDVTNYRFNKDYRTLPSRVIGVDPTEQRHPHTNPPHIDLICLNNKAAPLDSPETPKLDQEKVKTWLQKVGPVIVRLVPDEQFKAPPTLFKDYHGAVLTASNQPALKQLAVVVRGLDQDGNYLIRNSWGSAWGSGGHAMLSPAYFAAAVTEAWGIIDPGHKDAAFRRLRSA